MNRSRAIFTLIISLIILGSSYLLLSQEPGIQQPIAFNHRLHIEDNGIECIECHPYFMEHSVSGLPNEEVCAGCHEEAMTESPEEKKLVEMLAAGDGIYFLKLFHLPDHVYYSHRRHVAIAQLPCENCHGKIAESLSPPHRPLVKVDMDHCMECHEDMGVTNDCIACHR
ncbi:MAG: hypothetical protein A2Z06_05070 [Candidatus Glassbacteria bacterium RBG_16_58_8]|uniref:Cytochrome c7-like domain-containing protein n=1 Tax=Candidatus Glassbacteria bacterium RBG_16_58_8 TaxID=1817866 RepID=A0A1F5YB83_9BACT|nr:MAG: hypothetical protein A2Z06_05070 [Candidatus Glassbacteria bacterium RBG_16_58_8]